MCIRDRDTGVDQLKLGPPPRLDAVINLAARAGVRYSTVDPWIYYSTNVIGTLNLLEFCRKYDVPKFVLASTSSVYGNGDVPFHELQPTDFVLSPYAASKKAAEVLVSTYSSLYSLNTCILRYFTVYGPAGRPDMSVFRFIRSIYEGEAITLYGDGSQKRDFTYVDDVAKGFFRRGLQGGILGHPIGLAERNRRDAVAVHVGMGRVAGTQQVAVGFLLFDQPLDGLGHHLLVAS